MREFKYKKNIIVFAAILIIFTGLRLGGIYLPYHQDEWKNVSASSTVVGAGSFFAHPPLMQMIFVAGNFILDDALWSVALFSLCFYNILGSLSPDVDGAILPFFFLSAVYAYDKSMLTDKSSIKWKWLPLLIGSLLIGFLIKLSFILVIGTILIDYIWSRWRKMNMKEMSIGILGIFGFGLAYVASLYGIKAVYPAFDISIMMGHAKQFTEEGRNWMQIFVQGLKAIYYLSPLMIIPVLFIDKDIFRKTRIFFVYLILGFIFYFILFDFSRGALDKYIMFSIVPLSVICGAIFAKIFNNFNLLKNNEFFRFVILGIILSGLLLFLNFISHSIPPLYPKTEWFGKVFHFEWNFLNPFHGGSGPLGFYISFLFIAFSFIVSAVLGIAGLLKKEWRMGICIGLIIIGLSYNLVFAEEFLFGKINGSAPKVLRETVSFIDNSPQIKNVLTYNDTGNYELSKIHKYAGRIYATPQSEDGYRKKFTEHIANNGGYFLVVNIPRLSPKSFYGKFFSKCKTEFESSDRKIEAKVYSCKIESVK